MFDSITHIDGHQIDPSKVFLISGQETVDKVGGRRGLSPATVQRVVIADDANIAQSKIAELEPEFQVLGITALTDYESAARRLRAVASGASHDWVLLQAQ